jgi:hypothetical protein
MALGLIFLMIIGAGFLGGVINTVLAGEGFKLPRKEQLRNGNQIWHPGFIGNLLVGAAAAVVIWGALRTFKRGISHRRHAC